MMRGPRYASRGFSLVELMLSLTLGLIVIAGMAQLFRGTGGGHASMESAARAGESGRHALALLGHSARNAGFLGCDSRSGRIVNTLNGDLGTLFELDVTRPVEAFDDVGGSAAAYAGAAGIDPGRIVPGTDIVTFRRLDGPVSRVLTPVDEHPVVVDGESLDVEAGDFLLIGDCEQSSLFRLTGVIRGGGSAVLVREPGAGSHENSTVTTLSDSGKVYGPGGEAGGATVGRVMTETYFIGPGRGTDRGGEPTKSLWRRAGMAASAELVEGVHDLQVRFGVDTRPADGVASVGRYVGFDDIPTGGAVLAVQVRVASGDGSGLRSFGQTFSLRNAG